MSEPDEISERCGNEGHPRYKGDVRCYCGARDYPPDTHDHQDHVDPPALAAQPKLTVVPLTFAVACGFVAEHHRHHKPPVGHKFSIGVTDESGQLRGVAIVGRPVARHYDDGQTAEVIRSATDGCPNANSALYAAAWRTAKGMGYTRLITYTQAGESGASLRGAGWTVVGQRTPRKGWDTPSRARTGNGNDGIQRTLWEAKS